MYCTILPKKSRENERCQTLMGNFEKSGKMTLSKIALLQLSNLHTYIFFKKNH